MAMPFHMLFDPFFGVENSTIFHSFHSFLNLTVSSYALWTCWLTNLLGFAYALSTCCFTHSSGDNKFYYFY